MWFCTIACSSWVTTRHILTNIAQQVEQEIVLYIYFNTLSLDLTWCPRYSSLNKQVKGETPAKNQLST